MELKRLYLSFLQQASAYMPYGTGTENFSLLERIKNETKYSKLNQVKFVKSSI